MQNKRKIAERQMHTKNTIRSFLICIPAFMVTILSAHLPYLKMQCNDNTKTEQRKPVSSAFGTQQENQIKII